MRQTRHTTKDALFCPILCADSLYLHLASTICFTHTSVVVAEREGPMPAKRAGLSALGGLEEDVMSLEEMEQCHPFAKKVLSILSYLMKAWNVHVEVEAGEISLQDCIEIYRPYDQSPQFDSTLGVDGEDFIADFKKRQGTNSMIQTAIGRPDHCLFSPFVQLRNQMIGTQRALGQAGFGPLA